MRTQTLQAALAAAALAPVALLAGLPTASAQTSAVQAPAAPAPAAARILPSAAAAYADYQGEVSGISAAPLKSAAELEGALDTFGSQNPDQLSAGWIAYSAMVAAQDKEFASAVRDIDGYYGRDRVISGMRNDVGYARTLKGGEKALQTALAVNSQDASRISSAAAFVKQQAYSLQNVAWGKARLKDASAAANRLKVNAKTARPIADAAAKFFAAPEFNVAMADVGATSASNSIWDRISVITASAPAAALSGIAPAAPAASSLRVDPKREGTANRIVTLAAFHVLEAESGHKDDMQTAMRDKPTFDCIDWSQLQLQACVSAAYTRADLSFCLAEHAIGDAGACFSSVTK